MKVGSLVSIFLLSLTTLITDPAMAQEEHHQEEQHRQEPLVNCDNVCREQVGDMARQMDGQRERAERAEEYGRNIEDQKSGVERSLNDHRAELERKQAELQDHRVALENTRRDLEGRNNIIQNLEGEVNHFRERSAEFERKNTVLERSVNDERLRIVELKQQTSAETESYATQIELGRRKLKKTESDLLEAMELIEEKEQERISINFAGIEKDLKDVFGDSLSYWRDLLGKEEKKDDL